MKCDVSRNVSDCDPFGKNSGRTDVTQVILHKGGQKAAMHCIGEIQMRRQLSESLSPSTTWPQCCDGVYAGAPAVCESPAPEERDSLG